MQCAEIESLLYAASVNDVTDMEMFQVKAHLANCESCANSYLETRSIFNNLKNEMPTKQLSSDAKTRMQIAIAHEAGVVNRRRLFWRISSISALSAAACLCFGVVIPRLSLVNPYFASNHSSSPAHETTLKQIWKVDSITSFHGSAAQTPVSSGGTIFTVAKSKDHNAVVAVKALSGQVLWRSLVETFGYLSTDSNQVYTIASSEEGEARLIALDTKTGSARWVHYSNATMAQQAFSAAVNGRDGVWWVHGNRVEYLSKENGNRRWQRAFAEKVIAGKATDRQAYSLLFGTVSLAESVMTIALLFCLFLQDHNGNNDQDARYQANKKDARDNY